LKGVINIPVNDIRHRIHDLEQHRDRDIHVICASGSRSMVAAAMLAGAGFRSVNVKGGMSSWRRRFGKQDR
jgi:rhodanese-related sulfurtransferase